MSSVTPPRSARARRAGLVVVLALEATLAIADARTRHDISFTGAYIIAPLVLALFAAPRAVAATAALATALALASGVWNDSAFDANHVVLVGVVGLASLLAVLSARARRSALQARAQTDDAARAAGAARERLDVVLGALAEAVTVHDQRGKTIYANDAAVRLLGASSVDELVAAEPGTIAGRFRMTREDGATVAVDELPGRRAVLGEPPEPTLTRSVNVETGDTTGC